MKLTQKQIIQLAQQLGAIDISNIDVTTYRKFEDREKGMRTICYSKGHYGTNGIILEGNTTNCFYVIATRSVITYCV